jgi:phosphoglucosamine mutase
MVTASASAKMGPSQRRLFGTDGIRGVANQDPMTSEMALRLGRAVAYLFRSGGRRGRVVIGKDTRLSGYLFESAIASGLCSMGADVMLCGPLPTPGIAFITSSMRAYAGVVISASHNPYRDNGIKIFARDGFKLPDDVEAEIERIMDGNEMDAARASGEVGKARRIDDAVGRYVVFLKGIFPRERTLDGMRVVVDCANGAAYKVAPAVLTELGADVTALSVKPDGKNINKECGALYPEHVSKAVLWHEASLGIALDGDADRVIFSDEKGQIVDGDAIMSMLAQRMIKAGTLKQKTLVTTVMSNLGLERAVAAAGGSLVRTQVGDRYVVEEMRKSGYNFGGEQSGHLVFFEHATTGDGVVAALQLLAILLGEQKPLSELAGVVERVPQVLESIVLPARKPLADMPELGRATRDAEQRLGKHGRVLVRWSGTEPKLRLMLEGPKPDLLKKLVAGLAEAARRDLA